MRRKMTGITKVVTVCLIAVLMFTVLTGCGFGKPDENAGPTEYTIQYTDTQGVHTIKVVDGAPYSITVIPEITGHKFLGLFDAEVGGTQYVTASGTSVSPYTDKKNIVLFPQYKVNEYKIILDYQGADITGEREMIGKYNDPLPELPKNLKLEHSEFTGWYTEGNCGGTQVADTYGLIPVVSVLNEKNFNIDSADGYIRIYAGFEPETFTVTFYSGTGDTEELQVAYGTPISNVVPDMRKDGEAVLTWSKKQDGSEIFTGKITDDAVLYAVEWAPVIELDVNGGDDITPVVQRAGATVAIPVPEKDNYKFIEWQDMRGNKYTSTTMPSDSITLRAVWQAKIIFDENGGTEKEDISLPAGDDVVLPSPEKENYIFAGWYTADKELYSSKIMPAASVKLRAGWYKAMEEKITITRSDDDAEKRSVEKGKTEGPKADWREEVDLSKYIGDGGVTVIVDIFYDMAVAKYNSGNLDLFEAGLCLYDSSIVSDANFLADSTETVSTSTYTTYNHKAAFNMNSSKLYICYRAKCIRGNSGNIITGDLGYIYYHNIWMNLTYPNTSYLYL